MSNPSIKLTFLGGAGTVTGSKTLLEYNHKKILIDCGLFQGLKNLRELNRASFKINPEEIDELILTHAHLDHCGYIPVLVKNGFKGKIHCTYPTQELTEIILRDSAKIQEEDAERANRHSYTKHETAKPLYTQKDVENALPLFVPHDYDEWVILDAEIKFQLVNAGHILGSAMVDMKVGSKKVVFSGDIGRNDPMLLYPPKKIEQADYVILESTYGDRIHEIENVEDKLLSVIEKTIEKKGILMIPSFAVERTQEIIYLLYLLKEQDLLPKIPIYLDTPMGIKSTIVFDKYPQWQDLPKLHTDRMYNFVHFIQDIEQSKSIVKDNKPKIVIAGSGMLEGGRILHYLDAHMHNQKNTLLFVGYQAEGTRGRAILKGNKEIKFFGEYHNIKCEIESISSLSGHADQKELMDWLKEFKTPPKNIFLNHGELHQSNALRVKIETEMDWKVTIPFMYESFVLE